MTDFSVLLPVYYGDDQQQLNTAIQSVLDQTVSPNEIVIVADGDLPRKIRIELDRWLETYGSLFNFYQNEENVGLGTTLKRGLKKCSNDLVARMDADDRSVEDRFERQLHRIDSNPKLDVIGGFMADSVDESGNFRHIRKVPTSHKAIYDMAKTRNPINHPTVMLRRSSVLSAGNYADLRYIQDYELWGRMLNRGYKFENIPDVLVINNDSQSVSERRGGTDYIQYEIAVVYSLYSNGFLTVPQTLKSLLLRAPVRLLPSRVRDAVYKRVLRDNRL
jgi:glycosyltransferase involved in cell wall biosynthesis